ncbi:DUF309 domain-containing protein [Rhodobacteraceae bacterium D3-12]|nr:DUF309 domain-containing protein [Rhodobacteraceae bacterium D3-12]
MGRTSPASFGAGLLHGKMAAMNDTGTRQNRPPYAYVPGQTPRHAEAAFDSICETARGSDGIAALERSEAWRTGWDWLRTGYYWEAHELFEAVWMALPQNSRERQMVQGLIQVANGQLKRKMGREKAVSKIIKRAEEHLRACSASGQDVLLGVPVATLEEMVAALHLPQRDR